MSGDLGRGTAHAAVALALGVSRHGPPGLVQVAGASPRRFWIPMAWLAMGRSPRQWRAWPLAAPPVNW